MNPMDLNFGKSVVYELVAEGEVRFFVHADILSSQSAPFREAMNGEWTEASERKFNLKDWDGDTVARMIQFLYKDDYSYPEPTPVKRNEAVATVSVPVKTPQRGHSVDLDRPLTPLNERLDSAVANLAQQTIPRPVEFGDFSPTEFDFQACLICHAKVYALAQYKSLDALRDLAYHRLLSTLAHIDPIPCDSHLAKNFVEFTTYGYKNTDSLVTAMEPLRELIAHFTALNFKSLQTEPDAVKLIAKGGDFTRDVMQKICRILPERGQGIGDKGFVSGHRAGCKSPARVLMAHEKDDDDD